MEATVGSVRDDGTSTPDQAKTKGVARRGWSPAIPFDLGADRPDTGKDAVFAQGRACSFPNLPHYT